MSINIGGNNNSYGYGQIKRGTTVIGAGATSSSRPLVSFGIMSALNANFDYRMGNHNFTFLDSPSTTSSTTYKVQVKANSSGDVHINRRESNEDYASSSSITVMEIKG